MSSKGYEITKDMLSVIRGDFPSGYVVKDFLTEEQEKGGKAIAITDDPKFGQNALQSQIEAFRSAVHQGAKFSSANEKEPESNPLVYFPDTGNLIFSGTIPSMANLKFQISINDATGAPYIFVNGLALTQQNVTVLNKLAGFTKNFIEEWSAAGDLLDRLK